MKALVHPKYGMAVIRSGVPVPTPGAREVLVRVAAAGVNPRDWRVRDGDPWIIRLVARLVPQEGTIGSDVAGIVEAVGAETSRFSVGDAVFGHAFGAFAEYVCVDETRVVKKPPHVSFVDAAAVRLAGMTALQGLRDCGQLRQGDRVLINGSAGGIGTYAIQIAKLLGAASVTGVCSTGNVEQSRRLGCDVVVDYSRGETFDGMQFDVVLDNVGNHSVKRFRSVLADGGRYVEIGPSSGILGPFTRAAYMAIASPFIRTHRLGVHNCEFSLADLERLCEMQASGELETVVHATVPLDDVVHAMDLIKAGHVPGKIVAVADARLVRDGE